MPSPTATRCSRTTTAFPATPRSTSCSAAQPKTTRADFIPLGRLCADPVLVLVNDQQPYKTLAEFVADAKKNPEKIVYSSGGFYGASHLPVALLEKAAGLTGMRHLPTAGGGPAITAALGNNAQITTQTVQATLSHVKAGKLRALASFGAQRSKALPDVPTMKELGYDVDLLSLGRPVRPEGHARSDRLDARPRPSTRPRASPQFNEPRSPTSASSRAICRRRSSRNSGTRTSSAPRTRSARSARWDDGFIFFHLCPACGERSPRKARRVRGGIRELSNR